MMVQEGVPGERGGGGRVPLRISQFFPEIEVVRRGAKELKLDTPTPPPTNFNFKKKLKLERGLVRS
jgi:hypothetical protein